MCVPADDFGSGYEHATALVSNSLELSGGNVTLRYNAYYNHLSTDFLDVDVTTNNGDTWTTLLSWEENHFGESVSIAVSAYIGQTVMRDHTTCGISAFLESCGLVCCDANNNAAGRACCGVTPYFPEIQQCCNDLVISNDESCAPSTEPSTFPSEQPTSRACADYPGYYCDEDHVALCISHIGKNENDVHYHNECVPIDKDTVGLGPGENYLGKSDRTVVSCGCCDGSPIIAEDSEVKFPKSYKDDPYCQSFCDLSNLEQCSETMETGRDDISGGCNFFPFKFQTITKAEAVFRDLDWYFFALDESTTVTADLFLDTTDMIVYLVDGVPDCSYVKVILVETNWSINLSAGDFAIVVTTTKFDGVPCPNLYNVAVDFTPLTQAPMGRLGSAEHHDHNNKSLLQTKQREESHVDSGSCPNRASSSQILCWLRTQPAVLSFSI